MRVIRNTIFVVAVILFVALLYLISLQDIEIKELRIREQMTLSSQAFCSEEKSALFVLMIQDEGRRNGGVVHLEKIIERIDKEKERQRQMMY